MSTTRRGFIRSCTAFLGYAVLFVLFPFKAKIKSAAVSQKKKSYHPVKGGRCVKNKKILPQKVAVQECATYNPDQLYRSIKEGLAKIAFRIKPGLRVLLKPNIIAQNTPDQATTTHPALVGAVCRIFTEAGCAVSIGDSSAFYQGGGTREGLETSGMADIAKKYSARLIPFETTRLRKLSTGKYLNPLYITEAVFEHDLVVTLPKLKVHRLARYTGAVKNCYGCVVGGTKQIYHQLYQGRPDYQEFWGKPLVDVYEAVAPGLAIMDAVIGLDRDGPAATGEPRQTGVVLLSKNSVALDVAACRMIGFDPEWVPAIREALERGLADPLKITVKGTLPHVCYVKLPDLTVKSGLSKKLDDYLFDQFIVEPRVRESACTQCDICINNCAVQAISYDKNGYPKIDYKRCIYCYCCEEYCSNAAIYLHGSGINHLIRGIRKIMKL